MHLRNAIVRPRARGSSRFPRAKEMSPHGRNDLQAPESIFSSARGAQLSADDPVEPGRSRRDAYRLARARTARVNGMPEVHAASERWRVNAAIAARRVAAPLRGLNVLGQNIMQDDPSKPHWLVESLTAESPEFVPVVTVVELV